VTWVWEGNIPHDVVSRDASFDPSPLQTAGTFQVTFPAAGVYNYYCSIHDQSIPRMRGVIEVR
jgi:plastocyanin